jgi:hypothetical protein
MVVCGSSRGELIDGSIDARIGSHFQPSTLDVYIDEM